MEVKEYKYLDFSTGEEILIKYCAYKKEIKDSDYIETLIIEDNEIDVYDDDYGQCYCLKYINENDEASEWGCGTYNPNYLDDAISIALHTNKMRKKKNEKNNN